MPDISKQYVRLAVEASDAHDAAELAEIERLEAQGFRIVGGGQTGSDSWEITDWRTGEVLGQGDGYDNYEAASDALDARQPTYHRDHVLNDSDAEKALLDGPEPLPGMPASLAEALLTWTWENPDDAREWVAE